jgi:hypothetical protein
MAAFTAIAAGVGMAATAATTTGSFIQAGKQRRLQQQAEADAAKAMADARKKLDVNYYESLAIQKEPYELEREALIAAGAQAIEAGRESERGAAAVAGRVQMAQQEGQAGIRTAMGKELSDLEKLTATEEGRLRDIGVQLDLEEVAGAQMAAAQAQEAAQKASAEGVQGAVNLVGQVAAAAPLYAKASSNIQKQALSQMQLTPEQYQAIGNVPELGGMGPALEGGFTNLDMGQFANMSNREYRQFMSALKPEQRNALMFNPQYTKYLEQLSSTFNVNPFGK